MRQLELRVERDPELQWAGRDRRQPSVRRGRRPRDRPSLRRCGRTSRSCPTASHVQHGRAAAPAATRSIRRCRPERSAVAGGAWSCSLAARRPRGARKRAAPACGCSRVRSRSPRRPTPADCCSRGPAGQSWRPGQRCHQESRSSHAPGDVGGGMRRSRRSRSRHPLVPPGPRCSGASPLSRGGGCASRPARLSAAAGAAQNRLSASCRAAISVLLVAGSRTIFMGSTGRP